MDVDNNDITVIVLSHFSFFFFFLNKTQNVSRLKKSTDGKRRPNRAEAKFPETEKDSARPRQTPFTCNDYSPSLKLLVTLLGWNTLTTGNRENTFNQRTATVETLLECIHSK